MDYDADQCVGQSATSPAFGFQGGGPLKIQPLGSRRSTRATAVGVQTEQRRAVGMPRSERARAIPLSDTIPSARRPCRMAERSVARLFADSARTTALHSVPRR